METPGALEVTQVPSVSVPVCVVTSVVPVCVVSTCVYTSVAKCVLRRTNSEGERRCLRGATSASESPCVDETPYANETLSETTCVSGVFASVPECVLPGTPCVKGAPQAEGAACAPETACVCEPPRVSKTPRVSAPWV